MLGVDDKVVFTGRVPHSKIKSYYDLIDLLVYPRHSNRLTELVTPMKPLEAIAIGKMLIASDVGGHRELIDDGNTGVLFRAEDAQSLAQSALAMLASPDRWPAIRAAAREFVVRERSWRTSVDRYRQAYAACVARRAI